MTPGQAERARDSLWAARRALAEARLLLSARAPEGAASRAYYAAFHAARATLTVKGRYAKTHSGQIKLFHDLFGPTPILAKLFELRGTADYEPDRFRLTAEDLELVIAEAAGFVDRCQRIVSEALSTGADEPDPATDD